MGVLKKLFNRYKETALQFFKFGIVGMSNTLIYLIIYYALIQLGISYILSNALGFIVSIVNAYFWNERVVFKNNEGKRFNKFLKVFIAYSGTFALSSALLYLLVSVIGVSKYIAPIINLMVTIPLNFILIKYWALKKTEPTKEETIENI